VSKASRTNLSLGALALVIALLDQWTKVLVRTHIPVGESASVAAWLDSLVVFTHIRNTGAAFGLGQGLGQFFVYSAFAAILLIVLYFRRVAQDAPLLQVALGLQLGGAIGNLLDRLRLGGVTDFVDFGWFPIFNLADSAITIGTVLLCVHALFFDKPPKERKGPEGEPHPDAGDSTAPLGIDRP
jgi:signal peptidase II